MTANLNGRLAKLENDLAKASQAAKEEKRRQVFNRLTDDELRLILTLEGRLETTPSTDPAVQLFALINYTTEHDDYGIEQFEAELAKLREAHEWQS